MEIAVGYSIKGETLIFLNNFQVKKWTFLFFRFEFKGKSASVSRGTNEEMEFYPKSLKIVEC